MGKTETHFGSIYFVVFSTYKKLTYWSRLTSKCSSWQRLNFLKSTTREGFYTGIISNTRLVECKLNCFLYAGAGIFPLNYRSDTRHLNISQPIRNLNILLLCVVSAKGISVKLKECSVKSASLFPSFALFSLPPPLSFLRLPRRLRFTCDTDRPLNLQTETRYWKIKMDSSIVSWQAQTSNVQDWKDFFLWPNPVMVSDNSNFTRASHFSLVHCVEKLSDSTSYGGRRASSSFSSLTWILSE